VVLAGQLSGISKSGWHEPRDSPSSAFRKVTQKRNPLVGTGAFSVRVSPPKLKADSLSQKSSPKLSKSVQMRNMQKRIRRPFHWNGKKRFGFVTSVCVYFKKRSFKVLSRAL
jgi:hypothetical protein